MGINEILNKLAEEGLSVSLVYFNQSYMAPNRWHLDLSQDEGVTFRLANQAKSLEEVVQLTWERWVALRDRGMLAAIALNIPALPPPEQPPKVLDDEIPF